MANIVNNYVANSVDTVLADIDVIIGVHYSDMTKPIAEVYSFKNTDIESIEEEFVGKFYEFIRRNHLELLNITAPNSFLFNDFHSFVNNGYMVYFDTFSEAKIVVYAHGVVEY